VIAIGTSSGIQRLKEVYRNTQLLKILQRQKVIEALSHTRSHENYFWRRFLNFFRNGMLLEYLQ
jgi:hypothetical protein